MNLKTVALFGQPCWGKYMQMQLARKGVNVEIVHLLGDTDNIKLIHQDEYGFDTDRILEYLKEK